MFFCSLAITKIQLFIEKLLFLPYYFGVGNFSKIKPKSVDFSAFRNRVDEIKFRNEVLNTVNKLLSQHEKKLLSENQCNLLFAFYIDESYKTIMVEIVSYKEVDNILSVRKIVKIIDKIKKKRLKGIIPIPKGNYIKLTIVRRYNA